MKIYQAAIALVLLPGVLLSQSNKKNTFAGNPVFPGWYADPEGIIFQNQYWIYPTYSAPFDKQVFLDAFSSPDLVHWTKHERILDTARVKWARRAMWAPSVIEKDDQYFLFLVPTMFTKMKS